MRNILVAYFSASGVTADAAEKLAKAAGGDLYEIKPAVPYTKADLDWMDKSSRSSIEMSDKSSRPALAAQDADIAGYDTILLGFPIWWYTAPTIINTFLESYDFAGKTVILFATSGSSGFEHSLADLKKSVSADAVLKEGIVVHGTQSDAYWETWAKKNL